MSGDLQVVTPVAGVEEPRRGRRSPAITGRRLERIGGGILGFALVIAGWWLAAESLGPSRLPSPWAVAEVFPGLLTSSSSLEAQGVSGGIFDGLVYTTRQVLVGVALGAVAGLVLGIALALSRPLNDIFSALVEAVRTIPPLAAIPFFLIWFGTGSLGQLLVIAFYTAVMVLVTARAAVDRLPPIYRAYAATLGASRLAVVRTVVLPGMVPEVVGGIRVALGFSWGIAVVAELIGAQEGIGYDLNLLSTVLQVDEIIAGIIWISLVAAAVDRLYVLATRHFTRWVPRMSPTR